MKTRIVRIGNSRGIRIPKPLIQQAGLGDDVELRVHDGSIIISRSARPREGWAEAASTASGLGQDHLLDEAPPTRFDEEDWKW
jgi:antitoxin MazE